MGRGFGGVEGVLLAVYRDKGQMSIPFHGVVHRGGEYLNRPTSVSRVGKSDVQRFCAGARENPSLADLRLAPKSKFRLVP